MPKWPSWTFLTEGKPVRVGRLVRPHGVRGEMKLQPAPGDSGAWRQARHARADQDGWRRLQSVRGAGKTVIVKLEGIDTPEEARRFCGRELFVPRQELAPPQEGGWWLADLQGLRVIDQQGRNLGELEDAFSNGVYDVYVVRRGRHRWLLPAVDSLVLEIDPAAGRILVDLPEGLTEL